MARSKWTKENIIKFVENEGYILIEFIEYKKLESKILLKCPKGHHWETTFRNFKGNRARNGRRCCYCNGGVAYSHSKVKSIVESFGYKLLNEYINAIERIYVECSNGHKFYTTISFFTTNNGKCPYCKGGRFSITAEVINEFLKTINYKMVSKTYINAITPILIKCENNHIFSTNWNKLQSGRRCPMCIESNGERRVKEILSKYNIKYDWQVEYDGLVGLGGGNLSYDFYIPKYNLLIEYQGEFHDGTVPYQTQEQFEQQQEHDRRKRQYASDNNINLLEIWYWDFNNIEKILCKELSLKLRRKGNKQLK